MDRTIETILRSLQGVVLAQKLCPLQLPHAALTDHSRGLGDNEVDRLMTIIVSVKDGILAADIYD